MQLSLARKFKFEMVHHMVKLPMLPSITSFPIVIPRHRLLPPSHFNYKLRDNILYL